VDGDAITIQMPNLEVRICAMTTSFGVSQLVAKTMGIWQEKGGLTT